jgi:Tfp pilus assembly protein PilN
MRLAINSTVNGISRSIGGVVFGIAYSLGMVYSGIVFVPLTIARPIIKVFHRGPSDPAAVDESFDTEVAVSTEVPTEESPEIEVEVAVEESPDIEIDNAADETDPADSELTNEDSQLEVVSSIESTKTSKGILSTFQDLIQGIVTTVRQAPLISRPPTVTLSMEEGEIRIVVFRGKRIIDWDYITLAAASDAPDEEVETPSDAARFREVLTRSNIRRARIVTDLPLFTSLERRFHLPQAAKSYVQQMVVSEVLDTIPFSSDEVDISWHSKGGRNGHDVVAVAAPRSAIDSQVRFARDVGLTPKGTYSKASALALASGIPDAILIHNQPSETGVVLVRGGSPIVVHHLETASPDTAPQDRADSLAVALAQVLGFYQTLVPGGDDGDLPVVMTGQVTEDSSYDEILSKTLGRKLLTCPSPAKAPEGFPTNEYAANLGLMLANKSGGNPWGKAPLRMGPTPNLLPMRHVAKGLPAQAFLIFLVLILMGAAINPTTVQVESLVQQVDDITADLVPLRKEVRERRTDVGLESEAKKELEAVDQQITGLETRIKDLDDEMITLLGRLESITVTSLPGGVRLASLAPGKGGFALNGTADTHDGVLQYAANLRASDLFSNATIEEITGSTRDSASSGLIFRILATVDVKKPSPETGQ